MKKIIVIFVAILAALGVSGQKHYVPHVHVGFHVANEFFAKCRAKDA